MTSQQDEHAGALVAAIVGLMRAGRSIAWRTGSERRATSTPAAVLKAISNGHTRPSDIAAELQVDLSVVSRAITTLHADQMIARTPDPNDARAQVLSITEAGRQRLRQLERLYVKLATELLSEWSDDDIDEATRIITRLSESLRGDADNDLVERLARAAATVEAEDATDTPTTSGSEDERQRRRSLATA